MYLPDSQKDSSLMVGYIFSTYKTRASVSSQLAETNTVNKSQRSPIICTAVTWPSPRPQFHMRRPPGAFGSSRLICFSPQTPGQGANSGTGTNPPQLETGGPALFILAMFVYPATGAARCFHSCSYFMCCFRGN